MSRKIVFVTDGSIKKVNFDGADVQKILTRLAPYDVDICVVEDQKGWPREQFVQFASAVEKQGPEAVENNEELYAQIKDAEAVVVNFSAVNARAIANGDNLKFICVTRSGCENVNLAAATEKGVKVSVCPGRVSDPVADFTVGMMLAEMRNIARGNMALTHKWINAFDNQPYIRSMKNCTVGIVGFGIIGQKVARRVQAFGSTVIAYDPFCPDSAFEAAGVRRVTLEELAAESDFVSVHARLSAETQGLIGRDFIARMKPGAYIVNTARAGLIDEAALVEALENKKIAGAALDVYWQEPLAEDHPLMKLSNVTLTPHRAGNTNDLAAASIELAVDELERYLTGTPLKNCKNA